MPDPANDDASLEQPTREGGEEGGEASAPADRLEPAPSGRAKCRACGGKIDKDSLRYGEALATGYGDGEGTGLFWFHPRCAALRRPAKFLVVLQSEAASALPERAPLLALCEEGVAHPRLERVAGAERASSGRATCRQCRGLIGKGSFRIKLSSFGDNGFFEPLGFVHAGCTRAYFEVDSVAERAHLTAPELDAAALAELRAAEAAGTTTAPPDAAPGA